jgi:hypothetical protein
MEWLKQPASQYSSNVHSTFAFRQKLFFSPNHTPHLNYGYKLTLVRNYDALGYYKLKQSLQRVSRFWATPYAQALGKWSRQFQTSAASKTAGY